MAKEILGKIPPQNIEAEAAVLGALLTNKEAMDKVADVVVAADFYRNDHQIIFRAILRLYDKRAPIDLVTLTNELENINQINEVGGAAYLAELVNAVPSAIHVDHYAAIVRQKAVLRRILSAGQKISELGYVEDREINSILDEAEKALFDVSHELIKDNFQPIADVLAASFDRIDRLHREKGILRGVTSGFKDLDNRLSGFQNSDLIILAARPSMGKCVAGHTQIIDPITGQLNTAEQLVRDRQATVATLDGTWRWRKAKPQNFIDDGVKPTFRVKTTLGRDIETTLIHPFLTITGWKHLAELKVGDRIATAKELPFFGRVSWPAHEVKMLAYLLADGNITGVTPRFTNVNPEIIADFIQSAKQFGLTQVKLSDSGGTRASSWRVSTSPEDFRVSRQNWAINFRQAMEQQQLTGRSLAKAVGVAPSAVSQWRGGRALPNATRFSLLTQQLPALEEPSLFGRVDRVQQFLEQLGINGKDAHEKELPAVVFSFTKERLVMFLNRLFSCDGSAYVANCNDKAFPVIAYVSVSKKLIFQVQHLLTRLGIVSGVRTKKTRSNGKIFLSFELEIHGREDLLKFCDSIGIFGKEAAVARVRAEVVRHRAGFTKDTLPKEIWQLIDTARQGKSWRSIAIELDLPESHNFHAFKRSPRRETVKKFAKIFNNAELSAIADSQVYWDRITSIEFTGCQPVYDLTIADTHNFVANDFVVHNTAMALNLALNAAVKAKTPTGFFSLEQSKEQLVDRLICMQAMVDGWKLRTGNLNEDDFPAIGMAMGTLSEAPIYIDDTPSLTPIEIRTRARRLKADHNLGLVIVDYLQLINGSSKSGYSDNRVQEVSEISRSLKALARELDVPVIALSQLSRAVESRDKKIPQLSDLRDSGSIEQDADVVMFMYREDYYEKDTERKGMTDILIRKHRNGPIGEVELHFRPEQARFFDVERKNKTASRASSE